MLKNTSEGGKKGINGFQHSLYACSISSYQIFVLLSYLSLSSLIENCMSFHTVMIFLIEEYFCMSTLLT